MCTVTTENFKEIHVEKINAAIDAIIDLEGFYSQMPSELSSALTRLNSLRNIAEEDIEAGDIVYDTANNIVRTVQRVGEKNLFFADGKGMVGKKFCYKRHF